MYINCIYKHIQLIYTDNLKQIFIRKIVKLSLNVAGIVNMCISMTLRRKVKKDEVALMIDVQGNR